MSAPFFCSGSPDIQAVRGGDHIIVTFGDGPSIMLSRHDFTMTAKLMDQFVPSAFGSTDAEIIPLRKTP